jgi:hypothetical protein
MIFWHNSVSTKQLKIFFPRKISFSLVSTCTSDFFVKCSPALHVLSFSAFAGTTTYEDRKKLRLQEDLGLWQNFQLVFGRQGAFLHFLFPFLPFPGPRVEPGYRISLQSTHLS